ncbi:serine/arginine repetitive matrix protein 1-like [Triticum dicoccoides]|uniref:serine/arginine repetitive matrix protein 1-like n=1 Tax=Triticum dicoccoides TaxID=85692 RepID=UPI001890D3D6|nr:serine/arginine repetitive matrix protein 1-like [Triticum dicoccoides]
MGQSCVEVRGDVERSFSQPNPRSSSSFSDRSSSCAALRRRSFPAPRRRSCPAPRHRSPPAPRLSRRNCLLLRCRSCRPPASPSSPLPQKDLRFPQLPPLSAPAAPELPSESPEAPDPDHHQQPKADEQPSVVLAIDDDGAVDAMERGRDPPDGQRQEFRLHGADFQLLLLPPVAPAPCGCTRAASGTRAGGRRGTPSSVY